MVTPGISKRYHRAVPSFLVSEGYRLPTAFAAMDQLVGYFIDRLRADGDPKHVAAECLSGLRHYLPATRGQLNGGWRLLSAWSV